VYSETENRSITLPVDLIRTVAIILVILLHAANEDASIVDFMSPQGVNIWWASNGYDAIARTCIPLFVMLTGALLLQPSKTEEPLRVFFNKRWKRIGIPILFWAIVYFAWRFFINGEALNVTSFEQSLFVGPYVHFWYVYVLVGLYLLTPIVRIVVAHANWSTIRYFLLVWFVGTGIVPLLALAAGISNQVNWFTGSVFILTGFVGYFILGAYITRFKPRTAILAATLIISYFVTLLGTYYVTGTFGELYGNFLLNSTNFNLIFGSVALFLLLAAIPSQTIAKRFPNGNRVLKVISENTLPIYLFHVIVLETLQRGLLGVQISITTMNPIIEIPLLTAVTLLISLVIIIPLKKIPHVKDVIG
jgi:surface polysaccharide O-acyltransferase-like enzyme